MDVSCDGNSSCPYKEKVDQADDAIWILTSTFIIFTMQSGFGLLESGSVASKNEVNIMVKNAVDVIVGGLAYWAFGYALSFGTSPDFSNWFAGWGYFFVSCNDEEIGIIYPKFFFQASFATTATTIVSGFVFTVVINQILTNFTEGASIGAMAERTKLEAYIIFSFFNTLVFCLPAHWVWARNGWLRRMGIIDIAGAGPVHLVGGVTGLVATLLLKPRFGRCFNSSPPQMGSPTNALLGMFMLWWGWLGFNCGSTFGISGFKWKLAARSAVATLSSSVGGGTVALLLSYIFKQRKFSIRFLIDGILGSLVGITAFCALAKPWEGFVIGTIGAIVTLSSNALLMKLKIDDPVGCVGVHAAGAVWSLLSVGLFAHTDLMRSSLGVDHEHTGVFAESSWYLLGIQTLGISVIAGWTAIVSFILLKTIDLTIGLRVSLHHEIIGSDIVEHSIGNVEYDKINKRLIAERINRRHVCQSSSNTSEMETTRNNMDAIYETINSSLPIYPSSDNDVQIFRDDDIWKFTVPKSVDRYCKNKTKFRLAKKVPPKGTFSLKHSQSIGVCGTETSQVRPKRRCSLFQSCHSPSMNSLDSDENTLSNDNLSSPEGIQNVQRDEPLNDTDSVIISDPVFI